MSLSIEITHTLVLVVMVVLPMKELTLGHGWLTFELLADELSLLICGEARHGHLTM